MLYFHGTWYVTFLDTLQGETPGAYQKPPFFYPPKTQLLPNFYKKTPPHFKPKKPPRKILGFFGKVWVFF